MTYIIVGLGNPGEDYENTRHNAGRMVVEKAKEHFEFDLWKKKFFDVKNKKPEALISKGVIGKQKAVMILPETFMNKSGDSLKTLVKNLKQAEKMIVVHDDLDLPLGTIKVSFNRGSGGHKGLESVIRAVKTKKFIRIRIGISPENSKGGVKKPNHEKIISDFIVLPFKPKELDIIKKTIIRAVQSLEMIIVEGLEKAMGEFNKK